MCAFLLEAISIDAKDDGLPTLVLRCEFKLKLGCYLVLHLDCFERPLKTGPRVYVDHLHRRGNLRKWTLTQAEYKVSFRNWTASPFLFFGQ